MPLPAIPLTPEQRQEPYWRLTARYRRWQAARNLSPNTIETHASQFRTFHAWLVSEGLPTDPTQITPAVIQRFISVSLETRRANTAVGRYGALRSFFRWLVDEDEIATSPMERLTQPKASEPPPPTISSASLKALIKTCEKGKDFASRRDLAILGLLMDTGMRRSEIAGITLDRLHLDESSVTITGKGNRTRTVRFGRTTARDLDRYLSARARHKFAALPDLWLGLRGALEGQGFAKLLRSRSTQAGLPAGLHLHLFRHTFADRALEAGAQESDVMRLAGWRSRKMLDRYGASRAEARAREHYTLLNLSVRDKL